MTLEEKIKIIENSASLSDVPMDAFPSSHKENYYFISYSHKDYKEVFKDILHLEEMGINIWYDNEMHIGENWREIAQLYISKFQCAGVIFYLTENSISSPACNQEVEYVLTHNKNFLSINKPLDGCGVQSGYSMLKELQKRGLNCSDELLENFEKAFSDEILYLGIDESIEKKARQISSIQREELLKVERQYSMAKGKTCLSVVACRDNTLINIDLSKIYQIDGVTDHIQSIGDCVFTNSIKLQKVKVANELLEIGESAFRNCISLENIDLSKTNGVSIGKNAFKNCTSLRKIDLSTVAKIGENAFEECPNLDINVLNGEICKSAFAYSQIKNIKYVSKDPKINEHAFWGCKNLESFEVQGNFDSDLGSSSFYNCSSLHTAGPFISSVNTTRRAKTLNIGPYAFNDCESLQSIKFKGAWEADNSTGIFWSCRSLKEIDFDIVGTQIPDNFAKGCESLEIFKNAEKFTKIGSESFEDCSSLKEFDMTNITELGKCAFAGSGIERAYLKNVETISKSAFANCENLKSIYIGENCKEIEEYAFGCCKSLRTLKILSENVQIVPKSEMFFFIKNLKTVYLRSKKVYDELVYEKVFDSVNIFYIGDNLNESEFDLSNFEKQESDERGFYKYVRKETPVFVDSEELIDITSSEINEPDPYSEKYTHYDDEAFTTFLGADVLIKHRRLKKPQKYFVEYIELSNEERTIEYLIVSTHTNKSFIIDGTLIESIEVTERTTGNWFAIDHPNELDGKTCCIIGNNEYHYCKIEIVALITCFGKPMPNIDLKYPVQRIYYSEDNEIKAISGLDIQSISVFNDDFETEKVINR